MFREISVRYLTWLRTGLKTGLIEMRSHLLRSALSTLGVMFGVFVMVVMLSLMGGLNSFLREQMGQWVGSVFIWEMRNPPEEKMAEFSRSPGLRFSDNIYLEEKVPSVEKVFKSISRREEIDLGGERTRVRIRGVDSNTLAKDFASDRKIVILSGRSLNPDDYRKDSKVCLISQEIAKKKIKSLMKSGRDTSELLGSRLYLFQHPFKVIGVYGPEKGDIRRWHMRRNIYIPLTAMQKYITGYNPNPGSIWLQVKNPAKMNSQLDDILSAMLTLHRGAEDFEYRKPDFLQEFISMMGNVARIMGAIALISLLTGGLGIMNVMLSSISERVREIGIRKALGAGNLQIFIQFIAETSTLCIFGGAAGALLGLAPMAFADAIEAATNGAMRPLLLPSHGLLVFTVVVFMGVVFGLYPALKACRMSPIDALRYE